MTIDNSLRVIHQAKGLVDFSTSPFCFLMFHVKHQRKYFSPSVDNFVENVEKFL